MSSAESETTFHHAGELLRLQYPNIMGIKEIFDDIAIRSRTSENNPVMNRRLFFEPSLEAQILRVPQETTEFVSERLREFGLFHLWTRISCPNEFESVSSIIIETDSAEELRLKLQEPCPYCGQFHDDDINLWQYSEIVYALNLADPVPIDSTKTTLLKIVDNDSNREGKRIATAGYVAIEPSSPSFDSLVAELTRNSKPLNLPAPQKLWKSHWCYLLVIFISLPILLVIANVLGGQVVTLIIAALCVLAMILTYLYHVRAVLAPSASQRGILSLASFVCIPCLSAGIFGVKIKGAALWNHEASFSIESGETDWRLVIMAILLAAFAMAVSFAIDFSKGWFAS